MKLINEVKAQTLTEDPNQDFSLTSFVPLILIFVIFYVLIIRPQSKKMKEHQSLVDSIKKGDDVITNSGILGKVVSIDKKENIFEIEISEGTNIKILKNYISETVKKEKKTTSKSNKKAKK